MVEQEFRSVIEVKAITMRRNAIFTAILVGLPPASPMAFRAPAGR